jgi:pimeloyl-ACP methyl ester carboxylesterase
MNRNKSLQWPSRRTIFTAMLMAGTAQLSASAALAGGEAGAISLRDQGYFWVGVRPRKVDVAGPAGLTTRATLIEGQMYVGFQLVQKKRHPYPLVLVHGGGGQATPWMGTPDGRDGMLDYFLAAGFDVYIIDRPGFGRSPNVRSYGELGAPMSSETIASLFTERSKQFPGGGRADARESLEFAASIEPGPSAPDAIVKEDMAELLDRIGPAILVTTSAGGPTGWLAVEARPKLVKGVLALESLTGTTRELAPLIAFRPGLASGEQIQTAERPSEREGVAPCRLQPEGAVHTAPAFAGKKILFVGTPLSLFTPVMHCSVHELNQLGADASLVRLTDRGIEGNGHMFPVELNNGEIAKKVLIPWLATIK